MEKTDDQLRAMHAAAQKRAGATSTGKQFKKPAKEVKNLLGIKRLPVARNMSKAIISQKIETRMGTCCYCGVGIKWSAYVSHPEPQQNQRLCRSVRCLRRYEWDHYSQRTKITKAKNVGVGSRYIRGGVLPNIDLHPAAEQLSCHESCFLCGPVGTGKTWALMCLACEALQQGYTVAVINWSTLQLEVRDTYKPGSTDSELDIIERYCQPDVICLDDLGVDREVAGQSTEAARCVLYEVINRRHDNNQILHITSNMPPEELKNKYDPRIHRRIVDEMCKVVVLKTQI